MCMESAQHQRRGDDCEAPVLGLRSAAPAKSAMTTERRRRRARICSSLWCTAATIGRAPSPMDSLSSNWFLCRLADGSNYDGGRDRCPLSSLSV